MERIKSIFRIAVIPEGQTEEVALLDFDDDMPIDENFMFQMDRAHEIVEPLRNQSAYFHDGKTITVPFSISRIERFLNAYEAQARMLDILLEYKDIGKCAFRVSTKPGKSLLADAILTNTDSKMIPMKGTRTTEVITNLKLTLTNLQKDEQRN